MTPRPFPPLRHRRSSRGIALVIILAFVVLLTVVAVAFFSRSIAERQLSASSSVQVKTEFLADGAIDTIIGDLKTEIAAGSVVTTSAPFAQTVAFTNTNVNSTNTFTYCIPTVPQTAVPCLTGNNPLPPNLVKQSLHSAPFFSGTAYAITGVPAPNPNDNYYSVSISAGQVINTGSAQITYPSPTPRACLLSTTIPALNGHAVTPAQWNAPILLPLKNPGSSNLDLTPGGTNPLTGAIWTITPPDWIPVDRTGNTPVQSDTTATTVPAAWRWSPSLSNTSAVIGRFAYNIYNEGGLLDMNVAGCPSVSALAMTGTTASVKNSLAMADLSQLGHDNGGTGLTVAQINAIIANPPGTTPPGYRNQGTYQISSGPAYRDSILQTSSANGFLGVNPNVANVNSTGPFDQPFPSRQSLINFILNYLPSVTGSSTAALETLADALNSMGTFSRSVEQPSFAPNPNRPRIINPSSNPATVSSPDSYMGNNDGPSQYPNPGQYGAASADDIINPPFLSARVQKTFLRFSPVPINGTDYNYIPALVGEPLVKYRFPLSRLSWITYNGPSGGAGNGTNIKSQFGIAYLGTAGSYGYYPSLEVNKTHIASLADVASGKAGGYREATFPELLKAAIVAGSLGKAGPNLSNSQQYDYQFANIDPYIDNQVIQIMANLICQVTPDSIPITIQFNGHNFTGVKDLPYLYRVHRLTVVTAPSNNPLHISNNATPGSDTFDYAATAPPGFKPAAFTGGTASLLYVPEVWNPHDSSSNAIGPNRPTLFRVRAVFDDPSNAGKRTWNITLQTYGTVGTPPNTTQKVLPGSTAATVNTSPAPLPLQFQDASGSLFREPTLLFRPAAPPNSNVTNGSGPLKDYATTTNQYTGLLVGSVPLSNLYTANGTTYILQGTSLVTTAAMKNGTQGLGQVTFYLDCQIPKTSTWVTYDTKYVDMQPPPPSGGTPATSTTIPLIASNNTTDYPYDMWANPLANGSLEAPATCYDPRSARFGVGILDHLGPNQNNDWPLPELNPAQPQAPQSKSANDGFIGSSFTVFETQRPSTAPGYYATYENPGMTNSAGNNNNFRFICGNGFGLSAGNTKNVNGYDGLWGQNDPNFQVRRRDGQLDYFFYQDPDGVCRRAMGSVGTSSTIGYVYSPGAPLWYTGALNGATPTVQAESRPLILNRPFRSVAEMGYAFRGDLWKQINFSTPESGDSALLDVFTVNELPIPQNNTKVDLNVPSGGLVAGKVDLNTRNLPVLTAILNGAYQDDLSNRPVAPPATVPVTNLASTEAQNIGSTLIGITTDYPTPWQGAGPNSQWHGPLTNIADLVGRPVYIASNANPPPPYHSGTDQYTYYEYPGLDVPHTYAGLTSAFNLDFTGADTTYARYIKRFRESSIRALADCGQTRTWNLLVDLVVQSGRYPVTATQLSQFQVDSEKRYWVHLAIDRYTGQVVDKLVEPVSQ